MEVKVTREAFLESKKENQKLKRGSRVVRWPFRILNSKVGMVSILGVGIVMKRNSSQSNSSDDNSSSSYNGIASVTQALGMGGLLTRGFRNKRRIESQQAPQNLKKQSRARQEFPAQYCITNAFSTKYCQNLAAVGKRQWGSGNWWDGRNMLNVDLYDFALYLDSKQVQRTAESTVSVSKLNTKSLITQNPSVPMTLMLRAQRPLPVSLLQKELGDILSRRLEKFSIHCGDRKTSGLQGFLRLLEIDNIPGRCLKGDSLTKGSMVAFQREDNGKLTLRCGDQTMGSMLGYDVSTALFDLYLGEKPVSEKARVDLAHSAECMKNDIQYIFG
eukprot:TRINITY_DN503_c0_g1_i2.p2 TRINITY_DN503_c0_g1~~TRINITY_DN503_c0_g1_i2.p2  ORF type:complete len:330 (+),score=31.13 TRINITY_DN503_c0_g1_i2:94-1083(+)